METKQTKRRTSPARRRRPASAGTGTAVRQRTAARSSAGRVRRRTEQPQPTPDVVYTPAKPFSRSRLLLQLATVLAVVLALTMGLSVFFKVKTVTVSGSEKYSPWMIKEASGIEEGDNLLSFGSIRACGRIIAELPYVESVRIGIKLPDTVNIEIKELDMVYSIRDSSGLWWLMTAQGKMVEQVDSATAGGYTQVTGVLLDMPQIGGQAVAAEPKNTQSAAGEEPELTIPVVVTNQDRLNTAMEIMQYLEENGIIGQITTINVDDLANLRMQYNGEQYEIRLGDATRLNYKIDLMYQAINSLKEYDTGLLDISFDLMEDKVIYEPGETA